MDNTNSSEPSLVSAYNPHFHVRKATKADVPSIAKMIKGLAEYLGQPDKLKIGEKELFRDGFSERPLFHCIVAEEVRQVYEEDAGNRLERRIIAQQKHQEILGVAIYYFTYSTWEGPMLYLEDIFVLPNARGQGIGTSLMETVANVAKSRDCCRMQWVAPYSKRILGFYSKLGATSMHDWVLFRLEKEKIDELSSRSVLNNDQNHEQTFLKLTPKSSSEAEPILDN